MACDAQPSKRREMMEAISEQNKELSDKRKKARKTLVATHEGEHGRHTNGARRALADEKVEESEDDSMTRKQRKKLNQKKPNPQW